ncbi:MAG: hypothetical protein WCF67_22790 [Chitinophagaceae bacterium]
MDNYWTDLEWEGQKIYLPIYTKLFRKVEQKFVEVIERLGFEECLFTKLPTTSQSAVLRKALPRLAKEWSKEIVDAKNVTSNPKYPATYNLCHWQCEPFYFFLQKEKPNHQVRFYDKSGWSYRIEPDINDFRLFEFQRIEIVWFAEQIIAQSIQSILIEELQSLLKFLGIETEIERKTDEELLSKEKVVLDLTTHIQDVGVVELVGSHLHGRLFIESLDMDVDSNYYTGCCGIGLNRIVNALIKKGISL